MLVIYDVDITWLIDYSYIIYTYILYNYMLYLNFGRVRPLSVGDVNITVMAAVDPDYPEPCGPEIIINKV